MLFKIIFKIEQKWGLFLGKKKFLPEKCPYSDVI